MKLHIQYSILVGVVLTCCLQAHPLIKSITNQTPFIFSFVYHNDETDCSPLKDNKILLLHPYKQFMTPMLLADAKPALVLQPVGYEDAQTDTVYMFVDEQGNKDNLLLEQAFQVWQKYNRKTFDSAQAWLDGWVGENIVLWHNDVEVLGYLLNVAFAKIENNNSVDYNFLSFSDGLFSRLMIDIRIDIDKRKGVKPSLATVVGQGGICQNGLLVHI